MLLTKGLSLEYTASYHSMNDKQKRKYAHTVRERYCKGCNICVTFCPKRVLTLKGGKVFAERPELCIGCTMCELRCPDFAIEVHEEDEESASAVPETEADYNLPPEAMHD
jgi:2-oxoglutarate ferredoxin oxidoreductase subunit delta